MTQLEFSGRKRYEMKLFCHSYKEMDGVTPCNWKEQRDSSEFLNGFLDRLNDKLKGTTRENLIRDVYGGKVIN